MAALEDEMTGKVRPVRSAWPRSRPQNAFVPALLEQLAAHSTLARAHCESAHTLSSLTTLTTLQSSVATLSSDVTSGALPRAVAALGIVRRQLEGDVEGWIKATEAWSALSKWASEEGARLEGALVGAVDGCFCFETTGEGAKLTLSSAITAAPRGESLSISTLLASLDKVLQASDPPKRIDVHLARIAKQLHRFFLQPFIESNGGDGGSREELVYGTQEQAQTVVRRPAGLNAAREPLVAVRQFLEFFATHSTLLPSSPFGAIFAANFTPPLQDLLIAHHLAPLLPLETSQLGSYLATLASAAAFEKEFLVKAGYLCFLPAGEEATRDEGRVMQDWIARVDVHWSRHLGSAALDQVRGEVATNDWKGELVEIEILEDDDEVMEEVAVLPLEESEEEEEVTDDEFELLDSTSHSMSTTPTPSTIALPPPVEPAPLSPPKPTGRKAKLVATKITPAPALPPPASTAVPATTPAAFPELLEEEDPWGLSNSPAEVSSILTSPSETSFPSAIAAPIPFPQLATPISVISPSSVTSNGLTPPIRSRVNSSASVGSEMDDPWGLEGVELDLDETSEQGAEVVEEEGDDAWGFGVDEGEESEPKPVPVPVAAPRPASIGRPYSPAVAILPQSSLAVPARPSHAKQESLGNWGWEHDDQAELLAGPAAEDEAKPEPVPVAPVPVSPVLVKPVAPVVVAPFPVEPVAPTPVALVPVPVTIPKVKKMRKVKKLRVAIPPIVKPKAEPTKRSEKILISTRSRAIVKIADGVLSSALEVISPSYVAWLPFGDDADGSADSCTPPSASPQRHSSVPSSPSCPSIVPLRRCSMPRCSARYPRSRCSLQTTPSGSGTRSRGASSSLELNLTPRQQRNWTAGSSDYERWLLSSGRCKSYVPSPCPTALTPDAGSAECCADGVS